MQTKEECVVAGTLLGKAVAKADDDQRYPPQPVRFLLILCIRRSCCLTEGISIEAMGRNAYCARFNQLEHRHDFLLHKLHRFDWLQEQPQTFGEAERIVRP